MNWKVAGMAGTALLTVGLSGFGAVAAANKFSGNVSLAVGNTWQDDFGGFFDESFASLGGEAKLNVAFSNTVNLQIDMQGVASFADDSADRDAGVQGAAHLYYRTNSYALGLVGGVGVSAGGIDSADYYFAGVEGQYYLENFTIGLAGGYLDSSAESFTPDDLFFNDAWYVNGEVRYYANEKTTLTANVGYISGEAALGSWDVETIHWGVKAEYRPDVKEPISLWVAYEGRSSDAEFTGGSFDKETHTVKIGVTFSFGVDGAKIEQDRSGPAFNQMDYGAIVVGG
jgi:hypothetical protein